MESFKERIYLSEIVHQAQAAEFAIEGFNEALQRNDFESVPRAFAAAQGLLSAAALISKLLWPAGNNRVAQERGAYLRRMLPAAASSPVLESRTVRNRLEHFDEDLDTYLESAVHYVDRFMGDPDQVQIGGAPAQYVRMINTGTLEVAVMGRSLFMQDLADAIVQAGLEAESRQAYLRSPSSW